MIRHILILTSLIYVNFVHSQSIIMRDSIIIDNKGYSFFDSLPSNIVSENIITEISKLSKIPPYDKISNTMLRPYSFILKIKNDSLFLDHINVINFHNKRIDSINELVSNSFCSTLSETLWIKNDTSIRRLSGHRLELVYKTERLIKINKGFLVSDTVIRCFDDIGLKRESKIDINEEILNFLSNEIEEEKCKKKYKFDFCINKDGGVEVVSEDYFEAKGFNKLKTLMLKMPKFQKIKIHNDFVSECFTITILIQKGILETSVEYR